MNKYLYNRNFGCRFKEIIENGYSALIIENEKIRASIYINKGLDIYEFIYKPLDIDFMWKSPVVLDGNRKTPFTKEWILGNFLDVYEGGWQDILPNIANPTNYKGAGFGFHGELYSLTWKYNVIENNPEEVRLRFFTRMERSPLTVSKEFIIKSNQPVLEIIETINNEADEEFEFMWGQHPAIGQPFLDENCVIDVPPAAKAKTHNQKLSENEIIPLGVEFEWPYIVNSENEKIDASKVMSAESKTGHIIYLEDISDGWYGITNLKKKIGFGLKWDKNIYKHLWMWQIYRGSFGYPWYGRTYNIALEPWSSVPDDFDAVRNKGNCLKLFADMSLTAKYSAMVYETENRIKGFDTNYKPI